MDRIRLHVDQPPTHLWAHAILRTSDEQSMICDIQVYDNAGQPVADILGFRVEPVERKQGGNELESWLYQFQWELCRIRGTGIDGPCHFASTADMVAATRQQMPELYQRYGIGEYARDFSAPQRTHYVPFHSERILEVGLGRLGR